MRPSSQTTRSAAPHEGDGAGLSPQACAGGGRLGDPALDPRAQLARSRVRVPPGVRPPFEVYLNGVRQQLGRDYVIEEGALVFARELKKEGRLAPLALVPRRLGHRDLPAERLGRRALRARRRRAGASPRGLDIELVP